MRWSDHPAALRSGYEKPERIKRFCAGAPGLFFLFFWEGNVVLSVLLYRIETYTIATSVGSRFSGSSDGSGARYADNTFWFCYVFPGFQVLHGLFHEMRWMLGTGLGLCYGF